MNGQTYKKMICKQYGVNPLHFAKSRQQAGNGNRPAILRPPDSVHLNPELAGTRKKNTKKLDLKAFVPAVIHDRNSHVWFHKAMVTERITKVTCARGRAWTASIIIMLGQSHAMGKHVTALMVGVGCSLLFTMGCKTTMSNKPFPNNLLGPVKSNTTLTDMLTHPIWLWGLQVNEPEDADGVPGGDETGMRPWLGPPNVTREMLLPEILLKVKGTDLWAVGQYDVDRKAVDAIGVFGSDGRRPPWWTITTIGTPITYVAVPSIEGRKNVEFIAKNRRRWEALMVGAFTPVQTEQRYEQEISSNEVSASSPATLIRRDPALLKMVVPFLKRVSQDVPTECRGIVFIDVAGWLEDEDPTLHHQLLTDATTKQVTFRGCSCAAEYQDSLIDSKTGERGILLVVTDWRRDGDLHIVQGYWSKNSNHMQTVTHRVSMTNGAWMVRD